MKDGGAGRRAECNAEAEPSGRPAIHPVRRRTADRRGWAPATRRRFAAERVDEPGFGGLVALLLIDAVTAPFVGPRSGLRLADAG
jgi:hypothetical protein